MPDYLSSENEWDDESDVQDEGPSEEDVARFGDESERCHECGAVVYDGVSLCPKCGAFQLDTLDKRGFKGGSVGSWLFRIAIALVILSFVIWLVLM